MNARKLRRLAESSRSRTAGLPLTRRAVPLNKFSASFAGRTPANKSAVPHSRDWPQINCTTVSATENYFCQVRFLCRCARSFFRRLCLLILALRRFFSEPIVLLPSIYHFVE